MESKNLRVNRTSLVDRRVRRGIERRRTRHHIISSISSNIRNVDSEGRAWCWIDWSSWYPMVPIGVFLACIRHTPYAIRVIHVRAPRGTDLGNRRKRTGYGPARLDLVLSGLRQSWSCIWPSNYIASAKREHTRTPRRRKTRIAKFRAVDRVSRARRHPAAMRSLITAPLLFPLLFTTHPLYFALSLHLYPIGISFIMILYVHPRRSHHRRLLAEENIQISMWVFWTVGSLYFLGVITWRKYTKSVCYYFEKRRYRNR